ncbi:hypothetical protein PR202_ga06076 [Eleusine coracana subsp. coracana]|uniref:Uncharacterized protein n=1 Tax=Eleusine coracana subsp. coracana TaxID=191504 RepID=A0AAV5BVQ0_ELECO|nr:hypothetical protein PR202_ga06076 [Eleusine coracana subsp. coracana]
MEEDYDPELERLLRCHQPPGFYPQLVHRFRKRDSWEDRVAHVLHIVRVHLQFTLGHIDDRRTIYKEECAVRVKVEWTAILNSMRRNVFRYVEKTTCSPNLNTS